MGVVAIALLGVGFIAGMEYKAYQVRTALQDAFSGVTNTTTNSDDTTARTAMEQTQKENMVTIDKAVGDEIALATLTMTVINSEEKQTISSSYGSPKVAKEGTKFVVLNVDVTNTTDSAFTLFPDFLLVDDKGREYSTYSDTIGAIDNYLNSRKLSPSIKETGYLVYEIPSDAMSYSLIVAKAGTKELYKVELK